MCSHIVSLIRFLALLLKINSTFTYLFEGFLSVKLNITCIGERLYISEFRMGITNNNKYNIHNKAKLIINNNISDIETIIIHKKCYSIIIKNERYYDIFINPLSWLCSL